MNCLYLFINSINSKATAHHHQCPPISTFGCQLNDFAVAAAGFTVATASTAAAAAAATLASFTAAAAAATDDAVDYLYLCEPF